MSCVLTYSERRVVSESSKINTFEEEEFFGVSCGFRVDPVLVDAFTYMECSLYILKCYEINRLSLQIVRIRKESWDEEYLGLDQSLYQAKDKKIYQSFPVVSTGKWNCASHNSSNM